MANFPNAIILSRTLPYTHMVHMLSTVNTDKTLEENTLFKRVDTTLTEILCPPGESSGCLIVRTSTREIEGYTYCDRGKHVKYCSRDNTSSGRERQERQLLRQDRGIHLLRDANMSNTAAETTRLLAERGKNVNNCVRIKELTCCERGKHV
ncbi:hypothetical protein J6590_027025 [Homalodisca vitripennis]|nr:hypothetical protein J6590_027025 [Homalodisca vitripennis]